MTSDSYSLRYQTECTQEEKQSLQDARKSRVTGSTTISPPRVLFVSECHICSLNTNPLQRVSRRLQSPIGRYICDAGNAGCNGFNVRKSHMQSVGRNTSLESRNIWYNLLRTYTYISFLNNTYSWFIRVNKLSSISEKYLSSKVQIKL